MPVQCRVVVAIVVLLLLLLLLCRAHRIFARSDLRIQCPAHHVLFTLAQLAKIIIIIINHQGPSPRRSGCSGRLYNTKRHWHLSSRTRRFRLLRLNVEIPTIYLSRTRTIIIIVTMTNIAFEFGLGSPRWKL